MDNLTHSLVGALIGQAGLKRKTGLAMPALIIGANLPDVDAACFFWLDGVEHLAFRRGITHGPPALVLLPLVLAGLLWAFDRWQAGKGKRPDGRLPVRFGWLYALSFIGCLTHPALDWLNVYGIRLLEPFSSRWFYGDTLFIIDVWLWGLMGFATWWSLRQEKRGGAWRRTGLLAILAAMLYVNANYAISRLAASDLQDYGAEEVIASPLPLAFWKRELIVGGPMSDYSGQALVYQWSLFSNVSRVGDTIGQVDELLSCSDLDMLARHDKQLAAFMFWSRAPVTVKSADGSHFVYDARFYDPRARDRFSVRYEPLDCYEATAEPRALLDY